MDLTGKWAGSLTYGKEYKKYAGKELYFEFDIVQQANEISGTAIDTDGTGMSPDPANILGTVENGNIHFIKQYESLHYLTIDGVHKVDRSRKGPPIEYSGRYNNVNETFAGFWTMHMKIRLLWIIPITLSSSGTWTMKRK